MYPFYALESFSINDNVLNKGIIFPLENNNSSVNLLEPELKQKNLVQFLKCGLKGHLL